MQRISVFSAIALLALAPTAFAVPDADGAISSTPPPDLSSDAVMKARINYNIGYEGFTKSKELELAGASLTGAKARENEKAVMEGFAAAREHFRSAAATDPTLKEAWNMVGYTSRRLGDYDESLMAYDKALKLAPNYPEAIEYRAELFVLTGRFAEAKEAYASLLKSSPSYAGTLKSSMQDFIKSKQIVPSVAAADRAAFESWVASL